MPRARSTVSTSSARVSVRPSVRHLPLHGHEELLLVGCPALVLPEHPLEV